MVDHLAQEIENSWDELHKEALSLKHKVELLWDVVRALIVFIIPVVTAVGLSVFCSCCLPESIWVIASIVCNSLTVGLFCLNLPPLNTAINRYRERRVYTPNFVLCDCEVCHDHPPTSEEQPASKYDGKSELSDEPNKSADNIAEKAGEMRQHDQMIQSVTDRMAVANTVTRLRQNFMKSEKKPGSELISKKMQQTGLPVSEGTTVETLGDWGSAPDSERKPSQGPKPKTGDELSVNTVSQRKQQAGIGMVRDVKAEIYGQQRKQTEAFDRKISAETIDLQYQQPEVDEVGESGGQLRQSVVNKSPRRFAANIFGQPKQPTEDLTHSELSEESFTLERKQPDVSVDRNIAADGTKQQSQRIENKSFMESFAEIEQPPPQTGLKPDGQQNLSKEVETVIASATDNIQPEKELLNTGDTKLMKNVPDSANDKTVACGDTVFTDQQTLKSRELPNKEKPTDGRQFKVETLAADMKADNEKEECEPVLKKRSSSPSLAVTNSPPSPELVFGSPGSPRRSYGARVSNLKHRFAGQNVSPERPPRPKPGSPGSPSFQNSSVTFSDDRYDDVD